jgi:hypothetical protein
VRTVADVAPVRRYQSAPPLRALDQTRSIPARGYAVLIAASAVTAAAVAFATVPRQQSVEQPTYQVASHETRVYRQVEPRHSFSDRWLQAEVADQVDDTITAALIRPVKTVRYDKPGLDDSIAATVAYAAPGGGFQLASADSRAVELSRPATLSKPPAISKPAVKPEYDEVENYLWEVYQREPVKKDGAGDFTWKDPAAAKRMGMAMQKYVISGMDPDFREQLYHAGRAMDKEGVKWSILSAFRDDYRQSIASGIKASAKNSLHGGSVRTGGYGHGQAVDLTGTDGTNMDEVWDWIDDNGAKYGLYRPMPGYDPAHIQSRGDWRKLAQNLRKQRVQLAQQREREEAATAARVASAAAQ